MHVFTQFIAFMTTPHPPLHAWVVWTGITIGIVFTIVSTMFRKAKYVLTLVHELGHATMAILTGRRVTAIHVFHDTSGTTATIGKGQGIATLLAGYPTPTICALCAAWASRTFRPQLILACLVLVTVLALPLVRNLFGFFTMILVIAASTLTLWFARGQLLNLFGTTLTSILAFGAVRDVLITFTHTPQPSDPQILAQITRIPQTVWKIMFLTVCSTGAAIVVAALNQHTH